MTSPRGSAFIELVVAILVACPCQLMAGEGDAAALERALLAAVNAERSAHHLSLLALDTRMADVARAHSRDMAERGFFGHFDPQGRGPEDRLHAGYAEWVGAYAENVYHVEHADALPSEQATPEALARRVVAGWMGSPGHRQNLLRAEMTASGLGAWVARGDVWVTHDLGRPVAVLAAPLPACVPRGQARAVSMRLGPDLAEPGSARLEVLLVWPDPARRFTLPDGAYLEGAQPLPYRRVGARIDIETPVLRDPGTYRLRLGREGRFHDLGGFQVSAEGGCASR